MIRTLTGALIGLAATLSNAGAAAPNRDNGAPAVRPEACRAIASDAARLACYDQAVGRSNGADSAKESSASFGGATQHIDDVYRAEPMALAAASSLLDGRWELDQDSKLGRFNLRAHRPLYLLPLFWSSSPNHAPSSPNPRNQVPESQQLGSLENKFQLSFKTKVIEGVIGDAGDLWFGYTQSSRWQLFDGDKSRPFRETNYEPEATLMFGIDEPLFGDWRARMLGLGWVHQSNGRSLPLSRSWDRSVLTLGMERPGWVAVLRPWWRVPEDRNDDDNRDISDYLGRADLQLVHQRNGYEYALLLRHSLRSGERSHGALQFDWSFPLHRNLRGHLQLFDGYGESLIDYNHRATYVGVGLSLLSWY